MKYDVFNKKEQRIQIKYACFGALSKIGDWASAHYAKLLDEKGNQLPMTTVTKESEQYEQITYVEGFTPDNLSYVRWFPQFYEEEQVEECWDLLVELTTNHPLFKGIEVYKDLGYVIFPLGDIQMDKTMLPMFILRDLAEESPCWEMYKHLKKFTDNKIWRAFLCTLLTIHYRFNGEPIIHMNYSDGNWINTVCKIGNVIDTILNRREPLFFDDTWTETELGYASYGSRPSLILNDGEINWEDYHEVEGVNLEGHPFNENNPATIDTCCISHGEFEDAFENKHLYKLEYGEELLQDIILKLMEVSNA